MSDPPIRDTVNTESGPTSSNNSNIGGGIYSGGDSNGGGAGVGGGSSSSSGNSSSPNKGLGTQGMMMMPPRPLVYPLEREVNVTHPEQNGMGGPGVGSGGGSTPISATVSERSVGSVQMTVSPREGVEGEEQRGVELGGGSSMSSSQMSSYSAVSAGWGVIDGLDVMSISPANSPSRVTTGTNSQPSNSVGHGGVDADSGSGILPVVDMMYSMVKSNFG